MTAALFDRRLLQPPILADIEETVQRKLVSQATTPKAKHPMLTVQFCP
jgi:hypothetical protein